MQVEDEMWKVVPSRPCWTCTSRYPVPLFAVYSAHGHARGAKICPTPSTPNSPIPVGVAKHGYPVVKASLFPRR
ncbi:hypothetical protein GMOD_00006576 [Pyrenophora seminiperda CCB06]|uniref:Uncharacterized protein n=1 Tax=Pyrenophora seminiperda CCB06 TaxID=1302712 RepID=A0A3M7MAB1_9PLEO|nr:hypothetical protein GMOD_00006576 [Pyrenophora seminiperda CCB06]